MRRPFLFFALLSPLFIPTTAETTNATLGLEQVRAYALLHAPSLARQRLSYSNVVETVVIARSRFDPTFSVRREWHEKEDPGRSSFSLVQTLPADLEAAVGATTEDRTDLTRYSVRLSKTLLGGGSFAESRIPVDRALLNEARQANTLSLEQRRLLLSVTRQFYGIVRDRLSLQLRELQIERARRNLEHALAKEDPLDIATARLRIPESELSALTARRAAEAGLLALRTDIGMPADRDFDIDTRLAFALRAIDKAADLARALEENERVLNARLDLELARLEARVARTRRFPRVSAQLTAEETRRGATDEPDSSDLRGEIVLEWPWLDRADRAEARRKLNELATAEISLHEVRQEVRRDIENAALRLDEAERALALQEERVKVLEQQMRLYQDRWENGEINILEYLRSQNNLEDARVQLVTQQTRYLELLAEYDFHVGR